MFFKNWRAKSINVPLTWNSLQTMEEEKRAIPISFGLQDNQIVSVWFGWSTLSSREYDSTRPWAFSALELADGGSKRDEVNESAAFEQKMPTPQRSTGSLTVFSMVIEHFAVSPTIIDWGFPLAKGNGRDWDIRFWRCQIPWKTFLPPKQ